MDLKFGLLIPIIYKNDNKQGQWRKHRRRLSCSQHIFTNSEFRNVTSIFSIFGVMGFMTVDIPLNNQVITYLENILLKNLPRYFNTMFLSFQMWLFTILTLFCICGLATSQSNYDKQAPSIVFDPEVIVHKNK